MPPQDDGVHVVGPDKKYYVFPKGTDVNKIQGYFRQQQTHQKSGSQMAASGTPAFKGPQGGESSGTRIEDALPVVGSAIGAAVASPGVVTAAGGAGLGAAAGEAGKQLVKRFVRGQDYPATSGQAAKDIGIQGAVGAGTELAGQALSKPLKALESGFTKTAARGARLPLTPSEAGVGGATTKTVEGFLGHAIPSRGIMDEYRNKQLERAGQIVEEEIGRISKFNGTPEQMGKLTQRAIDNSRARLKADVGMAYNAVDQMSQNVQVDTQPLKKTATKLMIELKEQAKLMDPKLLGDTEGTLGAIIIAPDKVPFKTMGMARSDLLAVSRKLDEVLPGKRAGVAKLLSKQMDDAMMDAARKGPTGLDTQLRVAQTLTHDMHERLESDLVKKIIDTGRPEDIAAYVKQGGLQDIRHLNSLLTKPQQRMVQAQVVRDALNGAIDQNTRVLDPNKFVAAINGLGEQRGQEIFGGQNYSNVQQTARLLSRLRSGSGGGMAAGLHNYTYLFAGPSALAALVFGRPEAAAATAAGVGAETVALKGLAKAMTNPAKSARVLHYMQLAAHGAPYAIYGLSKIVDSENGPDPLPPLENKEYKQLTAAPGVSGQRTAPYSAPTNAPGMLAPGNINLGGRPILHNPDGTVSSERSFSIGTDQGEVLIPRIFDGKDHTEREAIDHYKQTGQHMGIFDSPAHADAYAEKIHSRNIQSSSKSAGSNGAVPASTGRPQRH